MRRLLLVLMVIVVSFTNVKAQLDVQISQYWAIPTYYNPAASGMGEKINVTALSRLQWIGVNNAPSTFFVTADMPIEFFERNHGIGVVVNNDKAGLFSSTSFGLQYAYKLKMWNGELSLGLRVGMISQAFDGTKVEIPETPDHNPSDEAIPQTNVTGMGFDAGFGAFYKHKYFDISLSSSHLTAPSIELDEKSIVKIPRVFYLSAGGNIMLKNPLFEVYPSVMLKTTMQFTQFEASMRMRYNKMFWGGMSYRVNDAVVVMIGGEFKSIRVGYAYDIGASALAKVSGGSHEVFASYAFEIKKSKKLKNKHKSIRIL